MGGEPKISDEVGVSMDLMQRIDGLVSLVRYREPVSDQTKRDLDELLGEIARITRRRA